MKRILIRGGMTPFETDNTVSDIILYNKYGTNAGNMVYLYGVFRSLMVDEDVQIDVDHYMIERNNITKDDIRKINETYDMYIIPLADAFRDTYENCLKSLTKAIKKMKIPVVIVGVGMKIELNDDPTKGNKIDETVKKFVSAVLDKSSIIGVRGEITGQYLQKLGFKEDKDYTPIGCPSLYLHGNNLKLKRPQNGFNKDSKILVNGSMLSTHEVNAFMRRTILDYDNAMFIPQLVRELREVYVGSIYRKEDTPYPIRITDEVFRRDKARCFINVPSWFEFASDYDLSVGARMHGNIASINSGVPSIFAVKDGRMKELIDYHNMPYFTSDELTDTTNIMDIIANKDLYSIEKKHEANFKHYVDFLKMNEVDTVFKDYASPETTIFDEKIAQMDKIDPVRPIIVCSEEERIRRIEEFVDLMETIMNDVKKEISIKKRYERHVPAFVAKKFNKGHVGKKMEF